MLVRVVWYAAEDEALSTRARSVIETWSTIAPPYHNLTLAAGLAVPLNKRDGVARAWFASDHAVFEALEYLGRVSTLVFRHEIQAVLAGRTHTRRNPVASDDSSRAFVFRKENRVAGLSEQR